MRGYIMSKKDSIFAGNDAETNCQLQLDKWVAGQSLHNDEQDICCPDFSCCKPSLLRPESERIDFAKANDDLKLVMLITFLGAMIADIADTTISPRVLH